MVTQMKVCYLCANGGSFQVYLFIFSSKNVNYLANCFDKTISNHKSNVFRKGNVDFNGLKPESSLDCLN